MLSNESNKCPVSQSPDDNVDAEALKQRFGRDVFRDFDIDDPSFNNQFFDILDTMVAKCPVVRSNVGAGYWMVTSHEEVRRVGQDWKKIGRAPCRDRV